MAARVNFMANFVFPAPASMTIPLDFASFISDLTRPLSSMTLFSSLW